ncbi:unnamed protein product [Phytomonas sp. EM1]|nr:unnamed protein product [Phytomonas sp. EM1]|eukprot:CCW65894.1 unnamed protein product [Phytomonas sp. isolate EM1]
MDSIPPKLGLDIPTRGCMPLINDNLPLTSTFQAQPNTNIQNVNIKSTTKGHVKSTVSRSISSVRKKGVNQRIPIHYIFSKHNTHSGSYFRTPGAPGVGAGHRTTDLHLEPVSPPRTSPCEHAAPTVGTSVITFGSPLLLHGYADGINAPTSQTTTRNLANALHAFNSLQTHSSTEAHENCRHLSIEGVRTGEESIIEISEPHRRKESTFQTSSSSNQEEQRRRFCKIREECRNLTDQLQKKSLKIQRMRAIFALCIEASEQRSQIEWDYWVERDKHSHSILKKFHKISHATIMQLKTDYTSEINQLQRKVQCLRRELEDYRFIKNELKVKEVQIKNEDSTENERLKGEIERLRSMIEDERAKFAQEKEQLGGEVAESQNSQRRLAEKLRDATNELAEENFLIKQCRIFLKQICQPSFHVVKGASLEPVEPNRPEPTGFVLIPLVVLLHGYSLLPIKEREEVIRQYEHKGNELSGL